MKWFLNVIALLSALLFLSLEVIVLLYAINNRHFAYYYALFGLGSLLCALTAHYLNRKDPPSRQSAKVLHVFMQGLAYVLIVFGVFVLAVNYWLNEGM